MRCAHLATVPYAGMIRIRFDGLTFASQPQTGHPNGSKQTVIQPDRAYKVLLIGRARRAYPKANSAP